MLTLIRSGVCEDISWKDNDDSEERSGFFFPRVGNTVEAAQV